MQYDKKAVGQRIKELRETHGYTTEEIRGYLNQINLGISHYSRGEYRSFEDGTMQENFNYVIIDLCNLYNCTEDYLLCKSDEYEGVIFEHTEGLDDLTEIANLHKNLRKLKTKQLIHNMCEY